MKAIRWFCWLLGALYAISALGAGWSAHWGTLTSALVLMVVCAVIDELAAAGLRRRRREMSRAPRPDRA